MGGLRANPPLSVLNKRFPLPTWKKHLSGFKNYNYIINGLSNGFPIGIDPKKVHEPEKIAGETCYIPLSEPEKQGVTEWIKKGVTKGFICGPYDSRYNFSFGKLYLTPVFVVPKPNGTWRSIVHLSYKKHDHMFAINELLCEYMKTIQYIRFKQVVNLINNAGPGAYIFLIDALDAYYRVPTHPNDWKYMGIKWAKKYWVFRSLQMGCSSSPRIYTHFADAVEYICVKKRKDIAFLNGLQQLRHYIDDFFGALPTKKEAEDLYKSVIETFEELGIPTRVDKCFSPHTSREVLGWLYDTIDRMAGMVERKRLVLLEAVLKLIKKHKSDKKSLEKLLGRMQHASLVIFPGKAFVRRLEAVLHLTKFEYNVPIPLSNFVIEDLKWWANVLRQPKLCRTSFDLLLKHPGDGDFKLFTDASSKWGGGGYLMNKNEKILLKFQIDWDDTILKQLKRIRPIEIDVLELLMSIVGIVVILPKLKNKSISIYNDNPTAAGAIRTKAPRLYRLDLQFLVRKLATLAVENKFYFWGIHYTVKDGDAMKLADDLSRFQASARFKTRNVPEINITKIVNKFMIELKNHPLNLPQKIDISDDIREEYNILLNDDEFNYNTDINNNLLNDQSKYNILYN